MSNYQAAGYKLQATGHRMQAKGGLVSFRKRYDKTVFGPCLAGWQVWPLVFGLSLFLSGCGYTTRGFVYKEDKIVITPIVNNIDITAEKRDRPQYISFPLLLEKRLTNLLISKFNIDGHLKVVNQERGALRLTCSINNYEKEALRYNESEDIREQRLRLYIHMKLIDSKGKTLKDDEVVGRTSFFLTGANSKSEEAAQSDLIEDTARRILEAVVEAW